MNRAAGTIEWPIGLDFGRLPRSDRASTGSLREDAFHLVDARVTCPPMRRPTRVPTPVFENLVPLDRFIILKSNMIRSTVGPMSQQLVALDYAMGTIIELGPYADGGVIDTEWRLVRIPIRDLASEAFPLDRVFVLMFNKMSAPQDFYIDNVVLRQLTVLSHEMVSDRAGTISVDKLNHVAVQAAGPLAFTISSPTDIMYQQGLAPQPIGISRSAVDVNEAGEVTVYFWLLQPLLAGHSYKLTLSGGVDDSDNPPPPSDVTLLITIDTDAISPSIQVNQVGYVPLALKLA
jgi:hypothetical protein